LKASKEFENGEIWRFTYSFMDVAMKEWALLFLFFKMERSLFEVGFLGAFPPSQTPFHYSLQIKVYFIFQDHS